MSLRQLVGRYESRLKGTRFSNDIARYNPLHYGSAARTIREFAALDLAGRERSSAAKLQQVVARARRTAYGRSRNDDWRQWPVLDKAAIRDRPDDFACPRLISVPAATGGTTGTPLRLTRSLRGVAAEQAFIDSLLGDGRSFRTSRAAILRAFTIKDRADDKPPFGDVTQSGRCLMLSSYHLSGRTIGWYAEALAAFQPEILFAYPSMLARLLNLLDPSIRLEIPVILLSSETMPAGLRPEAEKRFGARLVDFYGLAERVALAWSVNGTDFFFSPAYGRTELLPSEHDAGMPGCVAARIVATGFWNDAMPLLRYDTGDLAILPAGSGPGEIREIELGLRPFRGILGRQDETILLPDGTVVYGLNQIPKGIERAWQVQIVQPEPLAVTVLVVPKAGYTDADSRTLLKNARNRFPPEVELSVQLVERLRQTAAGKTPFVVRCDQTGSVK